MMFAYASTQDTGRIFNPACDVEFSLGMGAPESSIVPIAAGQCQTLDYCRSTCGFEDAVQHGSFGNCCRDCVPYSSVRVTVSGRDCSNNCPALPEPRPTPAPTAPDTAPDAIAHAAPDAARRTHAAGQHRRLLVVRVRARTVRRTVWWQRAAALVRVHRRRRLDQAQVPMRVNDVGLGGGGDRGRHAAAHAGGGALARHLSDGGLREPFYFFPLRALALCAASHRTAQKRWERLLKTSTSSALPR